MKYTIGELADIIDGDRGKNYPQQHEFSEEGYCLFLNTGNVTRSGFSFESNQFISKEKCDMLRKGKLSRNDIVYTTRGTVGNAAFYSESVPYEHVRINSGMVIIRPNEEIVSTRLLYQILKSDYYRPYFKKYCTGSAQPQLPIKNFSKIELDLPELANQQRIADILSAYDDLIENNQKQIKLLEEAAQRLYKEWFVDLRFPGHENTPIIDGVPQGWGKTSFSEIFSFVRGKSYTSKELSENDGILMVNLKNIRSFGGYKRNAEKRFTGTYKEEQLLAGGDVVMGVTDMTQERRLVGHVALIPSFNEKVTFSMDLIKLIPYSVTKNYLYCTMQYGGYSEQIAPLANGVNVLHLKPEAMMKMEMLVPNELVMREFDIKFEAIRLKIEALEKQCDLAAQARERLLPKLMNGELEV